jgi:hypothetical protein
MSERPSQSRGRGRGRGTSLLLITGLGVLTAVLVVVFVLRLSRSPQAKVQLGTATFDVGRADRLVKPIAQGGPLLFQALRGSRLDLYVQHAGADPVHGWSAFEAHRPGGSRTCLLQWQPAGHVFVDPCRGASYPGDGRGLDQYPVRVESNGHVVIDLRQSTGTTPMPT